MRRFRVDRIGAAVQADASERAKGVVPGQPTDVAYVPGPDDRRVVLSIDPSVAWQIESVPVAGEPRTVGGRLEVEVFVGGEAWLERLLLALGPDARVLEPDDDRSIAADAARRILRRYRVRPPPLPSRGAPEPHARHVQGRRPVARRRVHRQGLRPATGRIVAGVLKIHVVHEGGHHYYVDDLVPGRAEGTLVAGEEPGVWSGALAVVARTGRPGGGRFVRRGDGGSCSGFGPRLANPGRDRATSLPTTSPSVRRNR